MVYDAAIETNIQSRNGLSVETAEVLKELHHKTTREDFGVAGEGAAAIRDLFHQKYRGSRYSFGYPACLNLVEMP